MALMRINASPHRTFLKPQFYDRPTAGGTVWKGPLRRLR